MFKRLGRCGPLVLAHGAITDIIDAATIARMQKLAPEMQVAAVPRVGRAVAVRVRVTGCDRTLAAHLPLEKGKPNVRSWPHAGQ